MRASRSLKCSASRRPQIRHVTLFRPPGLESYIDMVLRNARMLAGIELALRGRRRDREPHEPKRITHEPQ